MRNTPWCHFNLTSLVMSLLDYLLMCLGITCTFFCVVYVYALCSLFYWVLVFFFSISKICKTLPKLAYRFNISPRKNANSFFFPEIRSAGFFWMLLSCLFFSKNLRTTWVCFKYIEQLIRFAYFLLTFL